MAEQDKKTQQKPKQESKDKPAKEEKKDKRPNQDQLNEVLIRILGYDIPGSKNLFSGLTRIKGVSWAISNAICLKLGMPRGKKISELTKPEIQKIEETLRNLVIYDFMKNRRSDLETGETKHLFGTDLEITKDFDIKRQRKMKSYVGVRHASGQPVRGQRTKAHFRKKKVAATGKLKKPAKESK